MDKPKVGQILYSLNTGNTARYTKQKLTTVEVIRAGRKYFYCCEPEHKNRKWLETIYRIEDWREQSDYSATSLLFSSLQEWEDHKEVSVICAEISKSFRNGNNVRDLDLSDLRAILGILEKKTP